MSADRVRGRKRYNWLAERVYGEVWGVQRDLCG